MVAKKNSFLLFQIRAATHTLWRLETFSLL